MKRNLLIYLLILVCPLFIYGQGRTTISGTVQDTYKEGVPGATIVEKGTTNGTVTNIDGQFTLSVNDPGATLQISFIGYKTQDIPLAGKTTLQIILSEDVEILEEVVVTGYGGTQLRSKVTNSIAKVREETFANGMFSNPAQALSGAVAGLSVSQTSGDPGATPTIILRGGTNLDGSGSPLIIIDGQVRESLADINSEDIASMEVLKDAGATAIYGARANNGVVLITTKRGKVGQGSVNVKARVGLNFTNFPYEFLGAEEYLRAMRTSYQRASNVYQDSSGAWKGWTTMASLAGAGPYGTGNRYWADEAKTIPLDGNKNSQAVYSTMLFTPDLAFLLDQGWQTMIDPVYGDEIIFKEFDLIDQNMVSPTVSQDYNINLSGGNEKGSYYAGLGYNKSDGIAVGNWYKRITFTFNGDYAITDWLKSYTNINFNDVTWYGLSPTQTNAANYFGRVFSLPTTFRGYNADGELLLGQNSGDGNQRYNLAQFERDNNTNKTTFGQTFQIDFMKGLNLKLGAIWYYDEGKYESFNRDYLASPGNMNVSRNTSASYSRKMNQTYNAILNFDRQITPDHYVSAMAGFEYFDKYEKGFSASGSGAPTDDFMDLGLTDAGENRRGIDSHHTRQRIMSFFGRANYDYQGKYLISAVIRRDGYSRLLGDNRFGTFPGISAGWVFNKESFMEKYSDILSFGKLRASYGLNGNVSDQQIGAYTLQGAYGSNKYNGQVGYLMTTIPNPYLRWEKSHTFEIGLDLSFLDNKINTNWTYYNRRTADKYASIPLPASSGVTSMISNNGEIQNQGLELELGFRIIDTKDWKWNLNITGAYNRNKILTLPDNGLENNRQGARQVYDPQTGNLIWVGGYQEGQEPGAIYGFKAEGIYRSDSDIPGDLIDRSRGNNGSTNRPLYGPAAWAALTDEEKAAGLPIQAGDIKWRDVNGDGIIDDYDMVKLGNYRPKVTGGINTTVSWKDLTFSARLDYALGFKVVDTGTPWIMGNMQGTFNTLVESLDTWSVDNPNAKYPTYVWADQMGKRNYGRINTSMFVYNGNYLSLRELSLAYSLPKTWTGKLKMQGLQISVTGQSLMYLTECKKVYSPEVRNDTFGGYPLPRTVIFGLNLTFSVI
jgi:TonB-linked SusC/RagA family outer membrane protein